MTMAPGFGMEPTEPTRHPVDGPPPPQAAGPVPSPSEPQLGSRGLRLVAYILDSLLISFVVGAVLIVLVFFGAFLGEGLQNLLVVIGALLAIAISVGYFPYFWARDGQTLAMMPLGLRVVDETTGETISMGKAFLRLIGLWISIAIFYIGVIWILFEGRRRGWHDLIAGTIVIGEK
jgi:uncharacterized RDD family membrane protein YckC